MGRAVLEVEEVAGRAAFRRFLELPHMVHRGERRWSAPLAAWDRARLDPGRNPFFDVGDAAYFLLRRLGRPAGRITAQVATPGDETGWFGFFDIDGSPDHEAATALLVEAAADWLREQGCTSMTGPVSLTAAEEAGVLVEGFDVAGTTGRWWHPARYAAALRAAGLSEVTSSRRPTWRLPTEGVAPAALGDADEVPDLIGPYGDRRIVGTAIAAVPDLTGAGASAWQLAKRAKRGDWEGCTVVRCDGDAAVLVPRLVGAAADAGYAWVVAPWCAGPTTPPETVHACFTVSF